MDRATVARLALGLLDFSEPVGTTSFYKHVLRPALAAVGLPASRPATTAPDGARVPAVRGVRLHDLTAYVRQRCSLSAGVHFMRIRCSASSV